MNKGKAEREPAEQTGKNGRSGQRCKWPLLLCAKPYEEKLFCILYIMILILHTLFLVILLELKQTKGTADSAFTERLCIR